MKCKKIAAILLAVALSMNTGMSAYPQGTCFAEESGTETDESADEKKESTDSLKEEKEDAESMESAEPVQEEKEDAESTDSAKEEKVEDVNNTSETEQMEETETELSSIETEITYAEKKMDASSAIDQVKAMISALPTAENVTSVHRDTIMAAWNAFQSLSTADQAALDSEMGTKTSQSYGRDLESAYWALLALNPADVSTTLAAGTYDATTNPALSSTYSKGKSNSSRQKPWSVHSVTVDANGQTTGIITVESDSYTYIRTNGQTYQKTNSSGNSEFAGVPIDLNSTFYISAYSTSMGTEIAFSISTSIDESGEKKEEVPLTGIQIAENSVAMYTREVHDPLAITYFPENTTYRGGVIWSSSAPSVVSVDAANGEFSALAAGEAVITASAETFQSSCIVTVKEKVQDGKIAFQVSNKTAMFKVIDACLETINGSSVIYITLNGEGYQELYLGTYQQAVATGSDSSQWIKGVKRSDNTFLTYTDVDGIQKSEKSAGKWQFAIPVANGASTIQIQALSDAHKKDGFWWYPRQLIINTAARTLIADDYYGSQNLQIANSATDLVVSSAVMMTIGGPHSNSYSVSVSLNLGTAGLSKLYLGTAEKAEKNTKEAIAIANGQAEFVAEQIVGNGNSAVIASRIGSPFALSLYSETDKKWKTYEVTIGQGRDSITIKPFGADSKDTGNDSFKDKGGKDHKDAVDSSRLKANSKTMPGVVDNSTTLPDGVYGPGKFRFTFSGGSGRVIITCQKVEVKNGKAYATITFSRSAKQGGSSSYDSLRANGQVYSGNNTFTIPVRLNKNNTIVGRTIAMSAPHWVEYTIFISMSEPGKENGQDVTENTKELDTDAPSVMGLSGGKEVKLKAARLAKIFSYDDGFYLIEIDTAKDSFREEPAYQQMIKADGEESEQYEDAETYEESAEQYEDAEESIGKQIAALYANPVVKYLVVPEDQEVPAGLEKQVVIIRQPCENVYISSQSALKLFSDLHLETKIRSVGLSEEELQASGSESILSAMHLPEEQEGHISWGGSYNAWELRNMIKEKIDLIIENPEILPSEKDTMKEELDSYLKLAERCAQMNIAMFLDRSGDEKDEKAQKDWENIYHIIFLQE